MTQKRRNSTSEKRVVRSMSEKLGVRSMSEKIGALPTSAMISTCAVVFCFFVSSVLCFTSISALAQQSGSAFSARSSDDSALARGNDEAVPAELQGVGIDEHLGSKIDLSLPFVDETGKQVQLGNFINGTKPVLLTLVYFDCPNLCTLVLNSITDSVKNLNFVSGKQFDVLAVSFDPKETPELAAQKKAAYLKLYGKPEGASGWHFLTGKPDAITKLTQEVGYKYKWDDQQKQFAHTSATFVLTPEGKISRYFYGINYEPHNVRVALLEAGEGKIGTLADKFIMFCYHYDASTKRYVLLASRIMTTAGALTVAALAAFICWAYIKERNYAQKLDG